MKHGDKNAKTGKAVGQASGKKSSGKEAVEPTKTGKSSKAAGQGGAEAGKESRKAGSAGQKQQAGAKESVAPSPAKAGTGAKGGGKEALPGRGAAKAGPPAREGFSSDVIANAFKRAVKKYPNAFRRLTD